MHQFARRNSIFFFWVAGSTLITGIVVYLIWGLSPISDQRVIEVDLMATAAAVHPTQPFAELNLFSK